MRVREKEKEILKHIFSVKCLFDFKEHVRVIDGEVVYAGSVH